MYNHMVCDLRQNSWPLFVHGHIPPTDHRVLCTFFSQNNTILMPNKMVSTQDITFSHVLLQHACKRLWPFCAHEHTPPVSRTHFFWQIFWLDKRLWARHVGTGHQFTFNHTCGCSLYVHTFCNITFIVLPKAWSFLLWNIFASLLGSAF